MTEGTKKRPAPGTSASYADELRIALAAARSAGAAALSFYGSAEIHHLKEGASPVTAADLAANRVIVAAIASAFPDDAILSEECVDHPDRLHARRVWIIDPLDGTKEFLARNGEFSIMVALAVSGSPQVAVVYQPIGDRLFAAVTGAGAWLESPNGPIRLHCAEAKGALRLVGSRSHSDPLTLELCQILDITDHQPSGSVGIKCALIALGERDLYVHPVPYLKEWDTCAPELILREAGGVVLDCNGAPLRYNKADPRQPHGIVAGSRSAVARALDTVERLYARTLGT